MNKPDDQIVDYLREARRGDPPWAPIGRGKIVPLPQAQRVYDGLTLVTCMFMALLIGLVCGMLVAP